MRPSAFVRLASAFSLIALQWGCVGEVAPAQRYRIIDLGPLQCTGNTSSTPACQVGGVNDYCEVAGWDVVVDGPNSWARAYVWRPTSSGVRRIELTAPLRRYNGQPAPIGPFETIAVATNQHYRAFDINNSGEVVGASLGPRNEAVLWATRARPTDPNLGYRSAETAFLGALPGGGGVSQAFSINDEAQIGGSSTALGGVHAMFFTVYQGMRDLGDLPNTQIDAAEARAVSEGASVGGVATSTTGSHAFLAHFSSGAWTMQDLGDLPGGANDSRANAVHRGDVVVGQSSVPMGFHAFRWEATTGMVDIGDLPQGGEGSAALAIRDTFAPTAGGPHPPGDIVGVGTDATGRRAVAWQASASGMSPPIDLNTLIATNDPLRQTAILEQAGGVNMIGVISVSGKIGAVAHAFLLIPVDADVVGASGQSPFSQRCLGAFGPA